MSDDTFEQLLARSARRHTPPPGSCPDAGELAAYLDARLDPAERRQVERHVAACARCALHVATISRLEEAAGEHPDGPAPARWRQWQWAVPLATVVLAVAVWVAVPRDIDEPELREAPAAAVDDAAPGSAESSEALADARPVEPGRAGRNDAAAGAAPETPRGRVPVGQAASSQAKEHARGGAEEDKQIAPAPQRFKSERELERAEPPADARREARISASPDSPPSSPAARKARPPAGATAAAPVAADAESRADNAMPLEEAATLVVASPVPAVRWRVQGGRIERTIDNGGTWQPDHDETVGGLRVGAAPSADVCWLGGARGVVLRREPSGGWRPVPLPVAVDVRALTASSALGAVVTVADGRRLQTADGGRTWVVR